MSDLLNKVKERYFKKKAEKYVMDIERVRRQCLDRLPSDQMIALIEILEEERDSKELNKHINLED